MDRLPINTYSPTTTSQAAPSQAGAPWWSFSFWCPNQSAPSQAAPSQADASWWSFSFWRPNQSAPSQAGASISRSEGVAIVANTQQSATPEISLYSRMMERFQVESSEAKNENLYWEAWGGKIDCINGLIKAVANVDKAYGKLNQTPLLRAVSGGNTDAVKALIKAGADVDKADNEGMTALCLAAICGNTDSINALITAGANVYKAENNGITALILAAIDGKIDGVNALIENGTNLDQTTTDNKDRTALYWAARCGRTAVVNTLIAAGANVNKADKWGKTPLHGVATIEEGPTDRHTEEKLSERQIKAAKDLIAAGACLDLVAMDGSTPRSMLQEKFGADKLRAMLQLNPDCPYERGFPPCLILQNLCRQEIRRHIHRSSDFKELPIPQKLKNYLHARTGKG